MSFQTWVTLVNQGQQAVVGTEFTNSATATDISPGEFKSPLIIPANFLVPGNVIRVTAAGWYENETGKKPTINWQLTYGGIAAGKVLLESEALTSVEAAKEYPWRWESITRVKEVGESGKVQSTGYIQGAITPVEAAATAGASSYLMPKASKTGKETTINTTKAEALTLAVKYSEAGGAAQHLQCLHWLVEILN